MIWLSQQDKDKILGYTETITKPCRMCGKDEVRKANIYNRNRNTPIVCFECRKLVKRKVTKSHYKVKIRTIYNYPKLPPPMWEGVAKNKEQCIVCHDWLNGKRSRYCSPKCASTTKGYSQFANENVGVV